MALLNLCSYPDKKLKVAAAPITTIDAEIKQLASDLLETLYHEELIGIAATHAGIAKQLIVIDLSDDKKRPQILINPKILEQRGSVVAREAGIAMPGIDVDIARADWIKVEALTLQGEVTIFEATDLYARVLQHEIDQMNGVLFIDRVSPIKRERAISKFTKLNKFARQCESGCGHQH